MIRFQNLRRIVPAIHVWLRPLKLKLFGCIPALPAVFYAETIKTTGLAGGMHHAFKAILPAARHGL